jgi:hypothetical protein
VNSPIASSILFCHHSSGQSSSRLSSNESQVHPSVQSAAARVRRQSGGDSDNNCGVNKAKQTSSASTSSRRGGF